MLLDRSTHYCPGCGHGIVHRLLAEVMTELDLPAHTIAVAPVGCAVFAYDYLNVDFVEAPHGRAPAVATGIRRVRPEAFVLTYQGDGDLAAIGTAEIVHAAARGERITAIFVNNGIYGMTGGQMAPTTLLGQRTTSSPNGRDAALMGYPIRITEMLAQLPGVTYAARGTVADVSLDRQAQGDDQASLPGPDRRRRLRPRRGALQLPGRLGHDAAGIARASEGPGRRGLPARGDRGSGLGRPRRSGPPIGRRRRHGAGGLRWSAPSSSAGFGGQGLLFTGQVLARAAIKDGLEVFWIPSYGPEMRGGTASCTVIVGDRPIGSPVVDQFDAAVVMNLPSLRKFAPERGAGRAADREHLAGRLADLRPRRHRRAAAPLHGPRGQGRRRQARQHRGPGRPGGAARLGDPGFGPGRAARDRRQEAPRHRRGRPGRLRRRPGSRPDRRSAAYRDATANSEPGPLARPRFR